jgi:hypothetical protein
MNASVGICMQLEATEGTHVVSQATATAKDRVWLLGIILNETEERYVGLLTTCGFPVAALSGAP